MFPDPRLPPPAPPTMVVPMKTMNALVFNAFGGPDVLRYLAVSQPVPGPGEVLLRTRAIGLNFADIYRRRGRYHLVGEPPYIAGYEAAGDVVATGPEVVWPRIGDRIAVADVPRANAEFMVVHVDHALPVPDNLGYEMAAALPLQGLTAQYLAEDSCAIAPGATVLIHAASGGVGRLLVQMAASRGAEVIGLTSSAAKLAAVRDAGARHALLLDDGWEARVMETTGGAGVDIAYDSLGRTLGGSLRVTCDRGTVVFYGMAAGDPDPVDPRLLMDRSLTLTGGDLWSYLTSAAARRERAQRLFAEVLAGRLTQNIAATFRLADGADAHRFLEEGRGAGKVLLIP